MANLKSSIRNIRKIEKQTLRNRQVKSKIKTLFKKVQRLVQAGEAGETVQAAAREYISALDKAGKRGVLSINKVNRHKGAVSAHAFGSSK